MDSSLKPPVAARKPRSVEVHGVALSDPYAWLRDREDPRVLEYLREENAYTERVLEPVRELRERLYREMVGRIQETDSSVPVPLDDYYYYHRTEQGRQYPIHCRKRGSLEADEEVILDPNQLAVGRHYLHLGALRVSPDHRLLAYSADRDGGEQYTLRIKDLEQGRLLEERVEGTYGPVAWAADNRTLFYCLLDASHRPYRLMRHRLGEPPERDVLVWEEQDDAYFVSVRQTRSRRFLLLELESNASSEVRYLDADDPEGAFRVIEPRRPKVEYSVDHRHEHFYLLTNDEALEFRLVRTPVARPGRDRWEEVVGHRKEVQLAGALLFEEYLVVLEREGGLRRLRVHDFASGGWRSIDFGEEPHTVRPGDNPEFGTRTLRLAHSSLSSSESVFDCDMSSGRLQLRKREPVLGGFDPRNYASKRMFVEAADGARIPVSLVFRAGAARERGSPLLLIAYGAYGFSLEPAFSRERLSLLDRGATVAIAHVRGGGEMGRRWYESGKLEFKENTFDDVIACAEHLKREGFGPLALLGGSAGGLMVGAVINRRPELFDSAVARVPFVDLLNTMLDPSLPLTVIEYEEWGDPRQPEAFRRMHRYSPYDNVRPQRYPSMLVTAGLNDPRVAYWEPAKWVARLREVARGDGRLLLHTHLGAGHAGASGRYDRLREIALIYAFLLERFGLAESPPLVS